MPARRADISLRVSVFHWSVPERRAELLEFLTAHRDTVPEIAWFTGYTHPPFPLDAIRERAAVMAEITPVFRSAGLRVGINHVCTIGHLDENLDHSLNEPWQHLVDFDGRVSLGCYCAADPDAMAYVRDSYTLFARSGPEFIWLDDDLRMESHGPIRCACFCAHCLAKFAAESGREWTREQLVAALDHDGTRAERLALRRRWLEHNRQYLAAIFRNVREAVDAVDPRIELGLMTGESAYSGLGFGTWSRELGGPRGVPAKWRPGGGFYTDEVPAQLLAKAHSVGRQTALLPPQVTDIQYEHENFPYQALRKSRRMFTAEIAAAMGAGCSGVALNVMGITSDPFGEYVPYFEAVGRCRGFYDELIGTFGRSPCEGLWSGATHDRCAAQSPDGGWFGQAGWGAAMGYAGELHELGLPPAYAGPGAVTLLSGDAVLDFGTLALRELLTRGVLLDGPALARLHEVGLGDLAGFAVRGTKLADTLEWLSDDPLNHPHEGWGRDCRPSFWPQITHLIEPIDPGARVLAEVRDFGGVSSGACNGAFENRLGGRVAVMGYYPWRMLQSLAKSTQMKSVCRWLSCDTLPAYVESYHKVALWCRRAPSGGPALLALNASLDLVDELKLRVRDSGASFELVRECGAVERLLPTGADALYAEWVVRDLAPWEPVLLR
ncbi:MAG: hypothetical protein HYU66_04005 [Armatimonadetes bacterium]|nr:hypothetical protein [Armatimonadota bacterium]